MTKKIGVAFSGGGARGLAHVGVLRVLEELDVPIDMLSGTSAGGIVAALRAAGYTSAMIEDLISTLKLLDIVQWDRSGLGLVGRDKTATLLRELLGGDLTFDQLQIPLALTAVDLEKGEEVTLREGSVVDAILATTSLAAIFPPMEIGGRKLVDGAVLNPVPFDVLQDMGADRVIASNTFRDLTDFLSNEDDENEKGRSAAVRLLLHRSRVASILRILERSMSIQSEALIAHRMRRKPPDVMIEIPLHISLFDLDKAQETIDEGVAAARLHAAELTEIKDYALMSPWAWWWRRFVGLLRRD